MGEANSASSSTHTQFKSLYRLSTCHVTHVIKSPRLSSLKFAGSKVTTLLLHIQLQSLGTRLHTCILACIQQPRNAGNCTITLRQIRQGMVCDICYDNVHEHTKQRHDITMETNKLDVHKTIKVQQHWFNTHKLFKCLPRMQC